MINKLLIISIFFTIISCENVKETKEENPFVLKTFSAPLNDSISTTQANGWHKSNRPLDSLSKMYIDSFSTEDGNLRIKYQKDFKDRQDTICVLNGLNGGYAEYMWISKNSGKPENKHLFTK